MNTVSGEPADETMATKLRRQKRKGDGASLQDYVVTPQQRWIDGISTAENEVRQFVAVPSGLGYTVEAQITGEEAVAGIQFEVTKKKRLHRDQVYMEYPKGTKTSVLIDLEMPVNEFQKLVQEKLGLPAD